MSSIAPNLGAETPDTMGTCTPLLTNLALCVRIYLTRLHGPPILSIVERRDWPEAGASIETCQEPKS